VLAHGDAIALNETCAHAVGPGFALAPQRADAQYFMRISGGAVYQGRIPIIEG